MTIEQHIDPPATPIEISGPAARLHVEVLDRRGRLRMRTRVDELPCVIGRAYSCGLVLDDRYISAEHIRVCRRADGAIVIEDLGSANGTYNSRTGARVAVVEVTRGTAVRIGQTVLRFHTAGEPVEPALPLPGTFSPPRWSMPLAFVVVFGVFGGSIYLETYSRLAPGPFVFGGVALAIVMLSWAGAWALLSRVLHHQSHIGEHCVVVCSFVTVYILAGWALDYYTFAFAADRSAEVLEWIVPTVLIAALLYGHGRFSSALAGGQLMLRSAGFAVACAMLLGMIVVAESLDPDWTAMASFRGGLKPPLFRMVANDDLDVFFTHVEELKVRVDAAAAPSVSNVARSPSFVGSMYRYKPIVHSRSRRAPPLPAAATARARRRQNASGTNWKTDGRPGSSHDDRGGGTSGFVLDCAGRLRVRQVSRLRATEDFSVGGRTAAGCRRSTRR